MNNNEQLTTEERINTKGLRPFQRLPLPSPCEYDPEPEFFYENFVQHIASDMIKMMCVGLHIDECTTEELRSTIDEVLSNVSGKLLRNPIIQKYQKLKGVAVQKDHYEKHTQSVRTAEDFYRDYNASVIHRTLVVNTYLKSIGADKDIKDAWTVKYLKSYNLFKEDAVLSSIVDKSISKNSEVLKKGMEELAKYKADLWNLPRMAKANAKATVEEFNPASAKQTQELFEMLKIEPLEVSKKTDNGSWGRKVIERLLKSSDGRDKDFEEVLECMIDHSFSGIIRNNFLKAFDRFTIDGVLYGNIKTWGTKTLTTVV